MYKLFKLEKPVSFNPIALKKAKIVYNFGLTECNRVYTILAVLSAIGLYTTLALLSAIGLKNKKTKIHQYKSI